MKPIFLKVVSSDGVPTLSNCANQTHQVDGKDEKLKTDIPVIPRLQNIEYVEGEHYATNSIVFKAKHGWYVVGTEFYKVTDDMGIILSEYSDAKHQEYCEAYRSFLDGTTFETTRKQSGPPRPLTLLEGLIKDKSLAPPNPADDGWYVDPELWYFLIRQYKKRKNTLLIGSSGTGKTELTQFMIERLNQRQKKNKIAINIFDMAVSNPYKTFLGNLRAENGTTWFQQARFAKVIQQPGLVVKDELSRAAPTANNIFLPLLDGRRRLYVEDAIDEEDVIIHAHEDCVFWATANIGAEFVGTSTLDHALMNRYQQVAVHYPPADKESELLQKRFGIDKKMADALVGVADAIRKSDHLSKDVSTRQLFDIAELVHDGYKPVDAFKWSVLQQFEGSEIDGGERTTVMGIIQSM